MSSNEISKVVVSLCENEIFPALDIKNIEINAILLYGSRLGKKFRNDSDFDLIAIVESAHKINMRFDGARLGFSLDLQIFDKNTIEEMVEFGHLSYAINLQNCSLIYGNNKVKQTLSSISNKVINRNIDRVIDEIRDCDYIDLNCQLEYQMKSYNDYLNSKNIENFLPYNGRLFECTYDYIRLFIRMYSISYGFDRNAIKLLLCLESFKRHSCYLETAKKDWFKPVTNFVNSIESWNWDCVKKSINETHSIYFKKEIISDDQLQDFLSIKLLDSQL